MTMLQDYEMPHNNMSFKACDKLFNNVERLKIIQILIFRCLKYLECVCVCFGSQFLFTILSNKLKEHNQLHLTKFVNKLSASINL